MQNNKLNIAYKMFEKDVVMVPNRNGYGEALLELGVKNQEIFVLTGDLWTINSEYG